MSHKARKFVPGLCLSTILLVSVLAVLFPSSKSSGQGLPPLPLLLPVAKVQLLSGMPMQIAANELGISMIAGKDIGQAGGPPGNANAPKLKDVGIGTHPTKHENEPVIAANPTWLVQELPRQRSLLDE